MVVYFIIFLTIGIGIGFICGIEYKSSWSKWEDLGVVYNSSTSVWTLLQSRVNENGEKQFKHIKIQHYGTIPTSVLDEINKH